jgi:hypothetical protein
MIWRRLLAGVCGAICHRQKVPNACDASRSSACLQVSPFVKVQRVKVAADVRHL